MLPVEEWVVRNPEPGRACWTLKGFDESKTQFRFEMFGSLYIVLDSVATRIGHDPFTFGVELYLHTPGTKYWYHKGINLMSGGYVDVSFAQENVKFLPHPYKSAGPKGCIDTKDPSFVNPLKVHDSYSRDVCIHEVAINKTQVKCECAFQPYASKLNVTECRAFKLFPCYFTLRNSLLVSANRQESEICPDSCVNVNYKTSVSYVNFLSPYRKSWQTPRRRKTAINTPVSLTRN